MQKGKYQSGQMGQTVNLLAYAFGGSNPSLPTKNCGSSSVDRALAFQAEGRGFEPRLPLFWKSDSYRKISIWFLFLENAESARNYAVEVNQEVNQKFYECSNQRSVLQVENFSKWRIPLNGKSSQKRQTDYAEFRHIRQS